MLSAEDEGRTTGPASGARLPRAAANLAGTTRRKSSTYAIRGMPKRRLSMWHTPWLMRVKCHTAATAPKGRALSSSGALTTPAPRAVIAWSPEEPGIILNTAKGYAQISERHYPA